MGKHVHKLLEKDPAARMGVCAACGPVGLVKSGPNFLCSRRPYPVKPQEGTRKKSRIFHRISDVDEEAKTGTCSVCGPGVRLYQKSQPRSESGRQWYCGTTRLAQVSYKHGLTRGERLEMIQEADGRCEICGLANEVMCIDHDHKTDEIRGVLCVNCNLGLGNFQDSPEFLAAAIKYLSR